MIDDRQSRLFTAMRFPLIVLVLYSHAVGPIDGPAITLSLDGWNVYRFCSELFCRQWCVICICGFFLLSGFLFFSNVKQEDDSLGWFPVKLKKRVRTLLIPYLIWNALAVLAIFAKTALFSWRGIPPQEDEQFILQSSPLYWFVTGPANFPLWYLRDLMVMALLTPLLYLAIKHFRVASLVAIILFYVCYPKEPYLVSMWGFFFFSIGAWFAIHQASILDFSRRYRIVAILGACVLSVVTTFRTGYADYFIWRRLFFPFGLMVFIVLCDAMTREHPQLERRLMQLSAPVFFIYCAHEIYILGWTKGIFARLFGMGLTGSWLRMFFVPLIVLLVCLALYHLLNRVMPRTLAFCCGGRTKPQGSLSK